MARRHAEVTIEATPPRLDPQGKPLPTPENRDAGSTFILTEMPAVQGTDWALRTILALARGGADIPDDLAAGGMAGLAAAFRSDPRLILKAIQGLNYHEAKPLLDDLMACVKIKEAKKPSGRDLTEDDIQEITTFFRLYGEVLRLHIGFFPSGASSS